MIEDPHRFDGVAVLGVDEHVWQWLVARPKDWSKRIEVVAMGGFTGFKTAAAEELPAAVAIMDPFHVIGLAGDALENCRRRVQHDIFGRRGVKGDPLYQARRTLLTGASLLTEKQQARMAALFDDDQHAEVQATWSVYQNMITAYRENDRGLGKYFLQHTIDRISSGVPTGLVEIRKLARTLKKRAADVLGYFDRPRTSNGPPRSSTADSNTSAAPSSASATSPTTSPGACSKPEASDPTYTLVRQDPDVSGL